MHHILAETKQQLHDVTGQFEVYKQKRVEQGEETRQLEPASKQDQVNADVLLKN